MGGMNSCIVPRETDYIAYGNGMTRRQLRKSSRGNLSTTFNIMEEEYLIEQLNINTATAEELMTLPGISRTVANHIVRHRAQIGAFRRVEDLALVSGIGAVKLNQIRDEICVTSRRKTSSNNSSRTSSKWDLALLDNASAASSRLSNASRALNRSQSGANWVKVNVNTANVFQLMRCKGISQHLAENIVCHRDKKGHFKRIDDLAKVKGMTSALLSAVRMHLVLSEDSISDVVRTTAVASQQQPPPLHRRARSQGAAPVSTWVDVRRSATDGVSASGDSQEDMISLYGPLLRPSQRRRVSPFNFSRNDVAAVRVATWCMSQCSSEKANNPGVQEVFCMTILENGLSLVCVQDLMDRATLSAFCDELNDPTLPNNKRWAGHRGRWSCVISDPVASSQAGFQDTTYYGFVYDTSRLVDLISCDLVSAVQANGHGAIRPCVAQFKINRHDFTVINMFIRPGASGASTISADVINTVVEKLEEKVSDSESAILVGSFPVETDSTVLQTLTDKGYSAKLPAYKFTDITTKKPMGTKSVDNVWLSKAAQHAYTGNCDVIRDGMSSPWIPDGWSWGGVASNHCPVWTELYSDVIPQQPMSSITALLQQRLKMALPVTAIIDS